MLRAQVRKTISERALLRSGDHVLVACSGGADSIVLVHVLHALRRELGITLAVASIDHGFREESKTEVENVGRFAQKLDVSFSSATLRIDVEKTSLQAAAREARYQALHKLAKSAGATCIAVGHTMDDQAETVLSRLLRGGRVRSLSGIDPARQDGVIRPLIDCQREEVRRYALHSSLSFVDDPSNENTAFERVRIRHELIPVLRAEDSNLVPHLAGLADDARSLTSWAMSEVQRLQPDAGEIDWALWAGHPLRRFALRRWIEAHTGTTPTFAHLAQIDRLKKDGADLLLSNGWSIAIDQGKLVIRGSGSRGSRSQRANS